MRVRFGARRWWTPTGCPEELDRKRSRSKSLLKAPTAVLGSIASFGRRAARALLQRHGRPDLTPSTFFMTALLEHPLPGNVRALESVLKRAIARVPKGRTDLGATELTPELRQAMVGYGSPDDKRASMPEQPTEDRITQEPAEMWAMPGPSGAGAGKTAPADYPGKELVIGMLSYNKSNLTATARALGHSRSWLGAVTALYGLDAGW